MRHLLAGALGAVLVWGALGAFGYIAGWEFHVHRAGTTLVESARALDHETARASSEPGASRVCTVAAPSSGQLAGLLEVPSLHLTAPVQEGTTDAVLSVAVGHDPSSVWPGTPGMAAFLAHDVSYFVHLGELGAGDRVIFRNACSSETFEVTRREVVAQGSAIPEPSQPSIVLDTCYPSNALFFTGQRLLVFAEEISGPPPGATDSTAGLASVGIPRSDRSTYTVPAPSALVAEGLTLQQNEVPMGTMSLTGDPSTSWEQSPGPLALEAAAIEAYFGGLHAAAQTRTTWWGAIAQPGLAPPEPLLGTTVTRDDAPLDVDLVSAHGRATAVVLTTELTLSGGLDPGTYDEVVTAVVHGTTVTLGDWTLRPA